ncbi:MAG: YggS family pyridoxal phosphate-dependent enzyme [Azonexus sp.]|jgi:pyridoxal phosphate enzyme (YggS family)|nr:YggS family pyridoxal phosphate-dependent enzyme [Azonexus sp.]
MSVIASNLQAVLARIANACRLAGRAPESVGLLAVSKTWPTDGVLAAAAAGQRVFGESYAQEALTKMTSTRGLGLEWHFIGPLQSNKTRAVAEHFAWVHSIDRAKLAERLSAQRPAGLPPLQVCVQVNVSNEASKSGCRPEEALALCRAVVAQPNLSLRGLMTIPQPTDNVAAQRAAFGRLRQLREDLRQTAGFELDTLSMGMSDDLEAAVAEGATIVRVGTAIFGERTP